MAAPSLAFRLIPVQAKLGVVARVKAAISVRTANLRIMGSAPSMRLPAVSVQAVKVRLSAVANQDADRLRKILGELSRHDVETLNSEPMP
jgi:hypothetical protein